MRSRSGSDVIPLMLVPILVTCLVLFYASPSFLKGHKPHVEILELGPGVKVVGKNMLCIDYPQVHQLYYFATVKVTGLTTVRLVVGGQVYSLLPGKIVVCNVENSTKCMEVVGILKTLKPGTYRIFAECPIASATFCIQFIG